MAATAVQEQPGATAETIEVMAMGAQGKDEIKPETLSASKLPTALAVALKGTSAEDAVKAPTSPVNPAKALAVNLPQPQNGQAISEKLGKMDHSDAGGPVETQNKTPDESAVQSAAQLGGGADKGGAATLLAEAVSGRSSEKPAAVVSMRSATEPASTGGADNEKLVAKPVEESTLTAGADNEKLVAKAVEEITYAVSQRGDNARGKATVEVAPRDAEPSGRTTSAARTATGRAQQESHRPDAPEGAPKLSGEEIVVTGQGTKAPVAAAAPQGRPTQAVRSDNSAATGVEGAQTSEARDVAEPKAIGPVRQPAGTGLPRQVTDSLIDSAKLFQTGRSSRIEVRLSPPELGKVVISIRKQGDTIEGVLAVEKPETRRALEDAAAQVVRNLADSGVNVRRINVVQTGHETGARADTHEQPGRHTGSQARYEGRSSDAGAASYDIPAADRDDDPVAVQQAVENGALNLLV